MAVLVSVIVPIYNVEEDLPQCVKSIRAQTYSNLEIILVDDGSPDGSGKLADLYAQQDARIKVIHKANGGLSDARNVGRDIASGDYITFVDSDDRLELDFIEKMLQIAVEKNAAIVVCGQSRFRKIDTTTRKKDVLMSPKGIVVCSGIEAAKCILYQKGYDVSACGKLYKASTFANIDFPKGLLFEDIPTTYKSFLRAPTVAFCAEKWYCYQIREGSIETQKFSLRKMDGIKAGNMLLEEVQQEAPTLLCAARSRYVAINFHILAQIYEKIPERKVIIRNIKQMRKKVIWDREASHRVRIACLLTYLGFDLTVFLLRIMNRKKE